MKDLKEQLIKKVTIEQSRFNDYKDFLDVRKLQTDKIIEILKSYDFTEQEYRYLLSQDNLVQKLYNDDIRWHIMMGLYSDYARNDISCFLRNCKMREKSKSKDADEEM